MVYTDYEPDRLQLAGWQAALQRQADGLRSEIQAKQMELKQTEERLVLVRRLGELPQMAPRSSTAGMAPGRVEPKPTAAPARSTARASDRAVPKLTSQPARSAADGEVLELETAVIDILTRAGKPLHISEIRGRLDELGVPIPGRGDDANIIVRLSRRHRFIRTARGTYALAEWGLRRLPSRPVRKRGRVR